MLLANSYFVLCLFMIVERRSLPDIVCTRGGCSVANIGDGSEDGRHEHQGRKDVDVKLLVLTAAGEAGGKEEGKESEHSSAESSGETKARGAGVPPKRDGSAHAGVDKLVRVEEHLADCAVRLQRSKARRNEHGEVTDERGRGA